tara:strand:+ start:406 stop:1716 length:1311 start_codon:yes stop_codon:yes gene_type:complete
MIKKTIQILKSKLNEDFTKNIFVILSGSTAALALPIIGSIWLTRIYSPALDFTPLALFVSFCYTLSALGNSHYTSAILVADTNDDSNRLFSLAVLIDLFLSIVILIIVWVFKDFIILFFNASETFYYTAWLIPFTVLVMGVNAALTQWAYRYKKFKIISANRAFRALVTVSFQTVFGLYFKNTQGLITGFFLGQLISTIILSYRCLKADSNLLSKNSYKNLKELATKYNEFLKFQTFSDVINVFTQQMPNFLLSKFALNSADLGLYGQANRVIMAPSSLVTGSVADVFIQKANQDYQEKGNALSVFKKTRKLLFLIMIVPCLIVAIFGPSIFAFLFGEEWRQSGVYGQIIMIMVFPKFIVSSLSYMYIIARKQREDFYLHIYILVTTLLSFYLGYNFFRTTEAMLLLFSINYAVIYGIYYVRSYKFAKGNLTKNEK